MKRSLFLATCATALMATAPAMAGEAAKVGVVNFKRCVEESKIGKAERQNFDEMRKQMESAMEEKEKKLQELTEKFNNADYVDSLSPEAEAKVKEEYRTLTQQLSALQQQAYQMIQQANYKVVQKLADEVSTASKEVAKAHSLDLVLNEESSFFVSEPLDITTEVIKAMDAGNGGVSSAPAPTTENTTAKL